MDISKYRDNVELSDICVVVEGQEFNLHKFPLSINCEYFKNECKSLNKVTFKDFPGGKCIFEIIADHCYGKEIELTTENIGEIHCASEYLGMSGKKNLKEKCKKFIDRTFRSAEYSRCIDNIIELIESLKKMETDISKSYIDRGFTIIVQIWLRPLSNYKSNIKEKYIEDLIVYGVILDMDAYYIEKLIEHCSDDESKYPYISKLVVAYFDVHLLNNENEEEYESRKKINDKNNKKNRRRRSISCSSTEENETLDDIDDNSNLSEKLKNKSKRKSINENDKKEIFNTILEVLPNDINLGKMVTVDWLKKSLSFCSKYKCSNRNKLLQICGGMLVHASVEELKSIDPKNVTEMIEQTLNNTKVDKDLIKWIWDHHFLEMAQNAELDPVVFNKVVKNMPESQCVDPDVVFKIVLSILKNIGPDGQKYKDELSDSVDLEKITPENLEAAAESGFWNINEVCKIAIKRLKEKEKYLSPKRYFHQDSKDNLDVNLDKHVHSIGHYGNGNKVLSNFRSHSYTNYLNSISSGYDDDIHTASPELSFNHYPTSRYISSAYYPDSYLTLEENLKFELKKISDSYNDYYKRQFRSRSRRKYPLAHHY